MEICLKFIVQDDFLQKLDLVMLSVLSLLLFFVQVAFYIEIHEKQSKWLLTHSI